MASSWGSTAAEDSSSAPLTTSLLRPQQRRRTATAASQQQKRIVIGVKWRLRTKANNNNSVLVSLVSVLFMLLLLPPQRERYLHVVNGLVVDRHHAHGNKYPVAMTQKPTTPTSATSAMLPRSGWGGGRGSSNHHNIHQRLMLRLHSSTTGGGDDDTSRDDTDTTSEATASATTSHVMSDSGITTTATKTTDPVTAFTKKSDDGVGGFDPSEKIGVESVNVGDPQIVLKEKERSVTSILKELAAIQQQGPQKYCILGTRHCSYLHQQIIELLAYALVLSGNHVYTSGAGGTHAATIRGALRAERPDLLTVVLPQSITRQTAESQELLRSVEDVITMPQNDEMSLDVASRICNSYLLKQTDQLISFAFHESSTVIEATKEAKKLDMLVTVLYLD